MKTSFLTDSGLDLISLRKKEDLEKFWGNVKREFRKELREKRYERPLHKIREETRKNAENFALAAIALGNFFDGAKNVIKQIAHTTGIAELKGAPEATKSDLLTNDFNYAQYENLISEQAYDALHEFADVALGKQAEEFGLKRKWVEHANNAEFIGPLPEDFEAFRYNKEPNTLMDAFKEHSEVLANSDIGYHIKSNKLVFSEELVSQKDKAHPLCDGEKTCTVNIFKLKAEPAPQQIVHKLNLQTPKNGDLAPAYAHK